MKKRPHAFDLKSLLKSFVITFGVSISLSLSLLAQQTNFDSLRSTIQDPEILNAYTSFIDEKQQIEYGWICGIAGVMPKLRKEIMILALRDKHTLLESLLELPETEKQLYALEALIFLKLEAGSFLGSKLNEKRKELILSDKKIEACGGCLYHSETVKTILLKHHPEDVSKSFKRFLNQGQIIELETFRISGDW